MSLKACRTCGVENEINAFVKSSLGKIRSVCLGCQRERMRLASIRWREKNPEKVKASLKASDAKRKGKRAEYRAANAAKIAATNAAWRDANAEKIKARNAAYREKNKALLAKRQKAWREANREAYRAIHSKWKRNNKDKVNEATHRRRALIAGSGEHHTAAEWNALKELFRFCCAACGSTPGVLCRDHIVPVVKGGSNAIRNIQPLCKGCNTRKGDDCTDYRERALSILRPNG